MRVNYKRTVQSVAMSKWPNQSGIEFVELGTEVLIYSINPRMNDRTSHFRMEIPIEQVADVIEALKTFI